MEIQNKRFNDFCLLQFGRAISKEELKVIQNQIIQDINKLHVVSIPIRQIAIEVVKNFIEAILKNEKIDIEKEAQKATIEVLKEIGKMKAKSQEEKRFVIAICEYIKAEIE